MKSRLLFSGPFHAGQRERALEAVCARVDAGDGDVLYVVPSSAARHEVIDALVQRRCATFGVRVLSSAELPTEVERRARVVPGRSVDRLAGRLLAERASREACAGIFPPTASIDGVARQIAEAVESLERSGARPEVLQAEAERLGGGEGVEVFGRAWARLQEMRGELGRTQADKLTAALALLQRDPELLAGCGLLVLENLSLEHALERELVEAMIGAVPGEVLAVHEAAPLRASPAALSLARLRSLAPWDERPCAAPVTLTRSALERVFAAAGPSGAHLECAAGQGVEVRMLEAVGEAGEVQMAVRVVRRHLDAGVLPEEIQLLVHVPGRYPALIEEVFGTHGIPVAVPTGRPVAATPVGDVFLRLLRAALDPVGCSLEESLALARTPHVDLDSDRLERAVVLGGLLGFTTWGGLTEKEVGTRAHRRAQRFCAALEAAHGELFTLRETADATRTARKLARELRLMGNAFFARQRTRRRGGDTPRLRALTDASIREDNAAWEEIEKVLDRMPELLRLSGGPAGEARLALARRWLSTLEWALRATRTRGSHPPAGAVRVGGTAPGTVSAARVVLVLGLLEKHFPRQARQDPLLHDALRSALRERHGWHLPLAEELAEAEREAFLRAVTSATEVLYLSCPATDAEGKPALRSFFLVDVERALPYRPVVERERVSDVVPPAGLALREEELFAAVSHDIWQHLPPGSATPPRRAVAFAIHDVLLADGGASPVLDGARRPTRRARVEAVLPDHAPHRTLQLSASQINTVAHCTYEHFVKKVLAPEVLRSPEYDALERGSLLHDALVDFGALHDGWTRGAEAVDELEARVRERAARWPKRILDDPAARHTFDATLLRLRPFLLEEGMLVSGARGAASAVPLYHELAFGEQPDGAGRRDPASVPDPFVLEVETSVGPRAVQFRGSIDRVDILEVDGILYGVAIDYKTGRTSKHYAEDMLKGGDLQLRLYLLALEKFWNVVPVGALYLGFGDGVRHGAVRADFIGRIAGLGLKGQKVQELEKAKWDAFVHEDTPQRITDLVDRLARVDVVAQPRDGDCKFCELRPICRYEKFDTEELQDANV
jgi:hypothetical protein